MLFCLSDLGTSDDSSLSDSVVQDEGENQQLKQIFAIICIQKIIKQLPPNNLEIVK